MKDIQELSIDLQLVKYVKKNFFVLLALWIIISHVVINVPLGIYLTESGQIDKNSLLAIFLIASPFLFPLILLPLGFLFDYIDKKKGWINHIKDLGIATLYKGEILLNKTSYPLQETKRILLKYRESVYNLPPLHTLEFSHRITRYEYMFLLDKEQEEAFKKILLHWYENKVDFKEVIPSSSAMDLQEKSVFNKRAFLMEKITPKALKELQEKYGVKEDVFARFK